MRENPLHLSPPASFCAPALAGDTAGKERKKSDDAHRPFSPRKRSSDEWHRLPRSVAVTREGGKKESFEASLWRDIVFVRYHTILSNRRRVPRGEDNSKALSPSLHQQRHLSASPTGKRDPREKEKERKQGRPRRWNCEIRVFWRVLLFFLGGPELVSKFGTCR